MKIIIVFIILFISISANASDFRGFESNLIKDGLIDSNYLYTNLDQVTILTEDITKKANSTLPVQSDEYNFLVKINISPYLFKYDHVINLQFKQNESLNLIKQWLNQTTPNKYCNQIKHTQFIQANNITTVHEYRDKKNTLITRIVLHPNLCN